MPGSTHGYDVIDPTRLDPHLGTDEEFASLLDELDAHQMRLLIDIVPNHMATDPANTWWHQVLRLGPTCPDARLFDIDWSQHDGRVMVPTLGQPLADALAAGTMAIEQSDEATVLRLDGQRFPLDPATMCEPGPITAAEAMDLLDRQHYLPAYWRRAGDEGNYRRFFDIDGLVGVRVEDRSVFERTHARLLDLVADERVAGLRVDHIDGLSDPAGYVAWLNEAARADRSTSPVILVEKILATDETLPERWAVGGTTGYEFADLAGGLFIEAEAASFGPLALAAKRQVLAASFGASVSRLTTLARSALDHQSPGHDLSNASIGAALNELTVQLDVYRTYLDGGPPSADDRARLAAAGQRAAPNLTIEGQRALHHLVDGLLGDRPLWQPVALRWQQLSGAVMAKGVEDTATYRFDGLLGHAEVGSHPDRGTVTPAQFIAAMDRRQRGHPQSLNATSTHDSKRGEDVRARLYALTEWRVEWSEQVARWRAEHAEWLAAGGGLDAQIEHLIYQTLIAVWPVDRTGLPSATVLRVQDYAVKVVREAKRRSSWSDPDQDYEGLVVRFIAHLAGPSHPTFAPTALEWVARLGPSATTTSLALTVLKATCPGVPDVYQGTEVWTDSLTDPDNRRPVDFVRLEQLLDSLPGLDQTDHDLGQAIAQLLGQWSDGRLKLFVLRSLLHLRRSEPELMAHGAIVPLAVDGPRRDHLVAFARHHEGRWILCAVPRLMGRAASTAPFPLGAAAWARTWLELPADAPHRFVDVMTGQRHAVEGARLEVATVLGDLPLAVLLG